MSDLNTEWAMAQLDDFIGASTTHFKKGPPNTIGFGSYETAASKDEVVQKAQVVEQILDRVIPGWRDVEIDTSRKRWEKHREASVRARQELLRQDEVRKNLGDDAPEVSAAKLHSWVWSGAKSLWQSGHYRSAVEDSAKKVNAETQNKVGRRDVSETKLFQEAFSLDAPTAGKPRLRRMTNDGSDTYKSMQRGAMAFAEGIYAGIRNPIGHGDPEDISEQVGLEYLAALSVLARWVDDSTVEVVA
jgi:hypothetical protein